MERSEESLFDWVTRVLRDPDPSAELSRLGPRARTALSATLEPGEAVHVVLRGGAGQAIVGTGARVIVLRPAFRPGSEPACEVSSWSYLEVLGVVVDQRIVGGSVGVRVSEGECGIRAAGDWDDIRARIATLRGLIAGARSDSVRAEPYLIAL